MRTLFLSVRLETETPVFIDYITRNRGSTIKYIPASTRKSRKKSLSKQGIAGVTIAAFVFGLCLVISLLAYLEQRRRVSNSLFIWCIYSIWCCYITSINNVESAMLTLRMP